MVVLFWLTSHVFHTHSPHSATASGSAAAVAQICRPKKMTLQHPQQPGHRQCSHTAVRSCQSSFPLLIAQIPQSAEPFGQISARLPAWSREQAFRLESEKCSSAGAEGFKGGHLERGPGDGVAGGRKARGARRQPHRLFDLKNSI